MEVRDHEHLTAVMREQGISSLQLAARAGWRSHNSVERLKSGESKKVPVDQALRVAYILDRPVEDLFLPDVPQNRYAVDPKKVVRAQPAPWWLK